MQTEARRQWDKNNPEKIKEYRRRYRRNNLEKIKKSRKEWNKKYQAKHRDESRQYAANRKLLFPERCKLINKKWRQSHKIERYLYSLQHKIFKKGLGGSFTKQEWEDKKKEYNYCCVFCDISEQELLNKTGQGLTIDHKIPITKWKQWAKNNNPDYQCNDIENIQPLCLRCNLSKHNKIM